MLGSLELLLGMSDAVLFMRSKDHAERSPCVSSAATRVSC